MFFREESVFSPVILYQPFTNYPLEWYKWQASLATLVNSPLLKRWLSQIWSGRVLHTFISSSPTGNQPIVCFFIINNYAKSQERSRAIIGPATYPLRNKEMRIEFTCRWDMREVSVPKTMMETAELFLWHEFIKKLVYLTLI